MFVFYTVLSIWVFIQASYEFGRSKWLFQHIKVSISNSMVPFSYAKKRIVKPHQRCSDPTLVFLSLFFMYFSRKRLMAVNQDWKMVKFIFLWYCKLFKATFQQQQNQGSEHKFCARRGYKISINVRFSHDFEHLSLCWSKLSIRKEWMIVSTYTVSISNSLKPFSYVVVNLLCD